MIKITLTQFSEFVQKAGPPKLTVVRDVKEQGVYDPKLDYWLPLKSHLAQLTSRGAAASRPTWMSLAKTADAKKQDRYLEAAKGFAKVFAKGDVALFAPPATSWTAGKLMVTVKPELGVVQNGIRHIVKLHLRTDKVVANRAATILCLMREAIGAGDHALAVLDV